MLLPSAYDIGMGDAGEIQNRGQQIQMIVESLGLNRLREKFRIVNDERDVDHLLINGISLLAQPVR